jgi:hypothetical protein
MAQYFARYIAAAARARLSEQSNELKPVGENDGFIAGFALPHENPVSPRARAAAPSAEQALPWFFTRELAEAACAAAAINWRAATQLPAFLDSASQPVPKLFRGITNPVPIETDADGITFTLRGTLLSALPSNFVGAGERLARAPDDPAAEWICGSVAPLGGGRFRIALDRTWPGSPVCVALRHPGTSDVHATVHPGYLSLKPHALGTAQTITFAALADLAAAATGIPLVAKADSGMPVEFFIVAGPAVVEHGRLIFTPIPPRTKFPVKIIVTAWQWGRASEPRVQTAKSVTQSFLLTAPLSP